MNVAQQVVELSVDITDAALEADRQAIDVEQDWEGKRTIYTFCDGSQLVQSGMFQHTIDKRGNRHD